MAAALRRAALAASLAPLLLLSGLSRAEQAAEELLAEDDECLATADGQPPAHCALNALQRQGTVRSTGLAAGNVGQQGVCGSLKDPANTACADQVKWSFNQGKYHPKAESWYSSMPTITGVGHKEASLEDFQRLFHCIAPGNNGDMCGRAPCECSKPPCDSCTGGAREEQREGCGGADAGSIACKKPSTALEYSGATWPTIEVKGTGPSHIFAIGDWGGMDGSLDPIEGRARLVVYEGGEKSGPSVFPRSRWNKAHNIQLCGHDDFLKCFDLQGQPPCNPMCGYVHGVDDRPQILVAQALKARAARNDPAFLLNVGDNFYWGGIEKTCGTPMDGPMSFTAYHQFTQIFENVYSGPGLSGKPWLSVLGNHDWGGRQFTNGWDQQIAYTWHSKRWVLPAPYWKTTAHFVDQGFTVDLFFFDSNKNDAKEPSEDPDHNICSSEWNPANADCSAAGGPSSVAACPAWFHGAWEKQKRWGGDAMAASRADWQIAITHFDCGHDQDYWRFLRNNRGLDFLVTGHRHDQELWTEYDFMKGNYMGMSCIVTGGGGGITSEATPNPMNRMDWYGEGQYGFFDLTISKHSLKVESINYDGNVLATHTVHPVR